MAPRTRDEETEYYMEAGTFDSMDEPEYEPDDTDPDFDLTLDRTELFAPGEDSYGRDLSDNEQEVDQWAS